MPTRCRFPAAKLLQERRELFAALPDSHKALCAAFKRVKKIDAKRWAHESTGCDCWAKAMEERA